jgi:GDP-mannose 6-dehydrogenase
MHIAIFGIGYVGAVASACLASQGHDVIGVDINPSKVDCINAGRSPILEPGLDQLIRTAVAAGRLRATADVATAIASSQISFICVGTPSLPNGDLDLTHVERAAEAVGTALSTTQDFHLVVVRSTVLPGTTSRIVVPLLERMSGKRAGEHFGVAVCPEFLREGNAIKDYDDAAVTVLGVDDKQSEMLLKDVMTSLHGDMVVTATATAELIKYANNAWHATKIVFANEIGVIAKALGLDGRSVMDIVSNDKRLNISSAYMRPGFAFGGSCLPKDLRAITYRAKRLDVPCPMLDSLLVSNERHIHRALDMVREAGSRRVGLIGLSFKTGTDDLRESPAVDLAERLFGKGYDIRIFDSNICVERLTGANKSFIEARIPHLSSLLTNDVQDVIRHGDTLVIAHADRESRQMLTPLRDDQIVIDLGSYTMEDRPTSGRYDGICW